MGALDITRNKVDRATSPTRKCWEWGNITRDQVDITKVPTRKCWKGGPLNITRDRGGGNVGKSTLATMGIGG
jgi:hypothetical protein